MKLYIASGTYFGTQAEARAEARAGGGTFEQVEVPTDKPGLIGYLNLLKAHTTGRALEVFADEPVKDVNEDIFPERAPLPAYADKGAVATAQSLDLDEQWEGLPLARKLHFAALAVEDARVLVPGAPVKEVDPFS